MTDTLTVEGIQVPVEEPTPPEVNVQPPAAEGHGEAQQEQVPPAPIMETAFVVYMNPQGHWTVAPDVHAAAEMQIMRQPNVDDYFNGCSTVLREIAVQETAATTIGMLAQGGIVKESVLMAMKEMAEQAHQAQMNQQIQKFTGQQPGGAVDLSKLR